MRKRRIALLETAQSDIAAIDAWLANRAGDMVAKRFVDRILDRIETLQYAAERGTIRRENAGLRVIGLLPNVSVAFFTADNAVIVHRIIYGGQDWKTALTADDLDS